MTDRAAHLALLKQHLAGAQNRMKVQADRNRTKRVFQVGDQVLLKLQPYTQSSVANRPYPKLAFKFFGPYTILERIGEVAYRLQLPPESKIHDVFHVSQLKNFTPDHTPVFLDLPKPPDLTVDAPVPEEILDRRLIKKGNAAIPQGLITWTGIPVEAAIWEDLQVLKQRFPLAIAWGQAISQEGAAVTPTDLKKSHTTRRRSVRRHQLLRETGDRKSVV